MADVTLDAVNIHVVGIATEKSPKPDLKDLFGEDFLNDWWNFIRITSDLRERAFQALMAGIRWRHCWSLSLCLSTWQGPSEDKSRSSTAFLMNLMTGVYQSKDQLDQQIGQHLKTGWTVEAPDLGRKTSFVWDLWNDRVWYTTDRHSQWSGGIVEPFQMKPLHDLSAVSSVNLWQKNKVKGSGERTPTS